MIVRTPLVLAAAMLMATGVLAVTGSAEAAQGYQSRTFKGGHGSTWKTGRNTHGFQGRYGGCQYVGGAGPGGYRINRVCR